jgi:esterase/lipase superfamily enzyme
MVALRHIAFVFCLAIFLFPATRLQAQVPQGGAWVLIGSGEVDCAQRRTRILTNRAAGRFNAIRLVTKATGISIGRVIISYGNGQRHFEDRQIDMDPQDRTKEIDPRAEERFVSFVEIECNVQAPLPAKPPLEIYGLQTQEGAAAFPVSYRDNEPAADGKAAPGPAKAARSKARSAALPPAVKASPPTNWVVVGIPRIAPGQSGEQAVNLTRGGGSVYQDLQIKAVDQPVSVQGVTITYATGESETIPVNRELQSGQSFELNGINTGRREISRIAPTLSARSQNTTTASLEIRGRRDEEAAAGAAFDSDPTKPYVEVPVFFGTNRKLEDQDERTSHEGHKIATFSGKDSEALRLGHAIVTVPKDKDVRRLGEIPRPDSVLGIQLRKEDPRRDFTLLRIDVLPKDRFLAAVKTRLDRSKEFERQALVFVHGYNVTFDDAVFRTAQIAYDLGFDGAPFLYSWPSNGGMFDYLYDRNRADGAERYLREFLTMVIEETGATKVHLIAHSMGNQALMGVLKGMSEVERAVSRSRNQQMAPRVGELILAAPDIDKSNFSTIATAVRGFATGMTLYASGKDRALLASRIVWRLEDRAGYVPRSGPVVVDGVDTIDITAASTDFLSLNHTVFAEREQLIGDIRQLLKIGARPPRAAYQPARTSGGGAYWKYLPP